MQTAPLALATVRELLAASSRSVTTIATDLSRSTPPLTASEIAVAGLASVTVSTNSGSSLVVASTIGIKKGSDTANDKKAAARGPGDSDDGWLTGTGMCTQR
jgi:hypothetical protein